MDQVGVTAAPLHELIPEPRGAVGDMRLVISRGPAVGAEFGISAALTLVGRHRDCDIVIDDVTVSRCHAELAVRNGRCALVDGGSLNGTYVNRRSVESAELADGDEIWIGKMRFTFRTGDVEAGGIATKR
ncbi:Inner membrane component of T3SS domain-containing protein [Saccharopolyspora shandongensis]|uniref:Inner membrane component of T3SS domain-containing protein n=1 Tax=Saccharopolyspora shandongensis TaxID=418495 RepID=A0A1H3TG00_9PSEU|nr:FHA domain-containing protein [Saccharopolyspora shandongensis]SDZ48771.1 Inner membrane component of T3SS domain-containing protein [Saccharopolyspora shandongensis]